MPDIALAKGSYRRGSNVPTVSTNMLFETDPTNLKDQVSMFGRPGYETWSIIGTSPMRLSTYQRSAPSEGVGNFIYAVTEAGNLYKLSPDGIANQIGANGDANYQFAASSRTQLLFSDPGMASSDGATITPISTSFMDNAEAGMCWAFGGYAVALRKDSERFHWSAVGDFSAWDALDFASAESVPDGLTHAYSIEDYLYLGGSQAIEIWSLSGDAEAPFVRTRGRIFGCGISGGLAILENEIGFLVGGVGGVWQQAGEISKISPEWVDEIVADSTLGKAFAFPYDGHNLYVLNGTRGSRPWSMVYDLGTKQWGEWKSSSGEAFDANGAVLLDGRRPMLTAASTGRIYELNRDLYQDNGSPLIRKWTGLQVVQQRTPVGSVEIDCSVGVGGIVTNPQAQIRYSDDMGRTWSSWQAANIGRQGDYGQKVRWPIRKDIPRGSRIYQWRYAGNTEFTVRGASYNEPAR